MLALQFSAMCLAADSKLTYLQNFSVNGLVIDLAFSSKNTYLAANSGKAVTTCNLKTNKSVSLQYTDYVSCMVFSPDESRFVTAVGQDIFFYSFQKNASMFQKNHGKKITTLTFSPDGAYLASTSLTTLKVWNVKTRKLVYHDSLWEHKDLTRKSVDFHGSLIVYATKNAIVFYDLESKNKTKINVPNSLSINFYTHNKTTYLLVYSGNGNIQKLNLQTTKAHTIQKLGLKLVKSITIAQNKLICVIRSQSIPLAVFNQNKQNITDYTVFVTNLLTNKTTKLPLSHHKLSNSNIPTTSHVEVDKSSLRIIAALRDGTIRTWDLDNKIPTIIRLSNFSINTCTLSSSGSLLAVPVTTMDNGNFYTQVKIFTCNK